MYNKTTYFVLLYIVTWIRGVWCIAHETKSNNNNQSRIFGGRDTDIDIHPSTAFLEIMIGNAKRYCGGAILTKNFIVTTARCLDGAETIRAKIGSTFSTKGDYHGGFEYLTTSYGKHPQYNNETFDYDVGVINIKEGMNLDGETTNTVRLPSTSSDPEVGDYMTITGWGATKPGGKVPNVVLQAVKVPVISRKECRMQLRGISVRMFCVGDGESNKVCEGDYGSPAIGRQRVLNGLVSWGPRCGEKKKPAVLVRLGNNMIRVYLRTETGA